MERPGPPPALCGWSHVSQLDQVSSFRRFRDTDAPRRLFRNQAGCAGCHKGSTFTDVRNEPHPLVPKLHDAAEVGMDPAYAERTATGKYRTTPLRGLFQHAPYFHDGSAPDLRAVVNHYDRLFALNLSEAQKADLVEFLKSL